MKVSSFFLFCSGLENVSDTPVAYQSRSAACVEITLSSFYHKSKNIELPLGWLDIFFLSIFCVSVLFRGGAFSFSAAGISRRTGIGGVLIQTVLFFLVAIGVGVVIHFAMKWLDKRNPHTQRITIVSMAFCFAMAYIAEHYFGIADITGAYIAGIVLCAMDDAPYVERRVDISNYVIFAPVFFASIGLKTDISGLTPEILLFCICFVIVALLTKIIGCGLAAKICRFNWGDSLKVGVGMMTRGEVALIVAQKGLEVGVVDPVYFTAVILLIVVSSVATPLALKALFTKMPPVPHPSQTKA